jgi:hypothetical protein
MFICMINDTYFLNKTALSYVYRDYFVIRHSIMFSDCSFMLGLTFMVNFTELDTHILVYIGTYKYLLYFIFFRYRGTY